MARSRSGTRRRPKSNPQGILNVTAQGFGFVRTAEGEFFVPAAKMGSAFDGDLVELAPTHVNHQRPQAGKEHNRQGNKPSARVVRVIHRAHTSIVGTYEKSDPFGVVVPLDHHIPYDVFTMLADGPVVPDGAIVRVRMVEYPSKKNAATGVIEEVLGLPGQPDLDIQSVIAHYKLETTFDQQACDEAESAQVDTQGALREGYRDVRDRFVFTIDPVDARDFDDAVSIEQLENGWMRLGVHIADVSHYVPWASAVDVCARRRATSVYLVDRVIPMIPEALSNTICSLVPAQPRRTLSVDIVLDDKQTIQHIEAYPAVIESRARLSYDQADCYIQAARAGTGWRVAATQAAQEHVPQGSIPLDEEAHKQVYDALVLLDQVARGRATLRASQGGIDFEATEAKVVLDEHHVPVDVVLRRKTPATSCIEEAMILTNECVARTLVEAHMPGIFRVHEQPAPEALEALVPILQEFDYVHQVGLDRVVAGDPHALAAVLEAAHLRPEAELISSLVLRSMQRAVYRSDCAGHYGLGLQHYCHFTSPIRRYPDLVVHRMLKATIEGRSETFAAQVDALDSIAQRSSEMERVAEAAARESQDLKLVEYMRSYVGQRFTGIVSGVATYGMYVQLENTAEGLVAARDLEEYVSFDPTHQRLVGQESGRVFRLGQQIDVVLHDAPEHATRLDFRLAPSE